MAGYETFIRPDGNHSAAFSQGLNFPLTDAIVLTIGLGGLYEAQWRAMLGGPEGRGGPSSLCCDLLQALRHDVWASVRHLTVAADDVFVHVGAVRDLCGEQRVSLDPLVGGGSSSPAGGGSLTPYASSFYYSSQTSADRSLLGNTSHNGYASSIVAGRSAAFSSQNAARSATDGGGRATVVCGGLGPTLIDARRLRSADSAAAHFAAANPHQNYTGAEALRSGLGATGGAIIGGGGGEALLHSSSAAVRPLRHEAALRHSSDVVLIAVIRLGGRPDVPALLAALKAAVANDGGSGGGSYGSSASSSYGGYGSRVGSAILFKRATGVLLEGGGYTAASTFRLEPVLHSCFHGAAIFGSVSSSSYAAPRAVKSPFAFLNSAGGGGGGGVFSSASSASSSSSSLACGLGGGGLVSEKQHSIDRLILEALPYYTAANNNTARISTNRSHTGTAMHTSSRDTILRHDYDHYQYHHQHHHHRHAPPLQLNAYEHEHSQPIQQLKLQSHSHFDFSSHSAVTMDDIAGHRHARRIASLRAELQEEQRAAERERRGDEEIAALEAALRKARAVRQQQQYRRREEFEAAEVAKSQIRKETSSSASASAESEARVSGRDRTLDCGRVIEGMAVLRRGPVAAPPPPNESQWNGGGGVSPTSDSSQPSAASNKVTYREQGALPQH